jgi:hypothetical protein
MTRRSSRIAARRPTWSARRANAPARLGVQTLPHDALARVFTHLHPRDQASLAAATWNAAVAGRPALARTAAAVARANGAQEAAARRVVGMILTVLRRWQVGQPQDKRARVADADVLVWLNNLGTPGRAPYLVINVMLPGEARHQAFTTGGASVHKRGQYLTLVVHHKPYSYMYHGGVPVRATVAARIFWRSVLRRAIDLYNSDRLPK